MSYRPRRVCAGLLAGERRVNLKSTISSTAIMLAACAASAAQNAQHWASQTNGFDVRGISADGAWALVDTIPAERAAQASWVRPDVFNAAALDTNALRANLAAAPLEGTPGHLDNAVLIDLPMPEGDFEAFLVYESPVMEAGLAEKFPDIKTYAGRSIENPTARVRMTVTPKGFDAQIRREGPDAYIDRYSKNDNTLYTAYFKNDLDRPDHEWSCGYEDHKHGGLVAANEDNPYDRYFARMAPVTRKEYRIAFVCTGEYTQFHGGTVADGLAAIVTLTNRMTGIYEDDTGVKFNLVANQNLLIYTNGATDGLSNNTNILNQSTGRINQVIGSANYDVGHAVTTSSGGVAFLGVICTNNKGGGMTGLPSPIGDPFYVDYVSHEVGHQYGATHTFNGDSGSCSGGNRTASTAYEPGSATTIMGYAGICGNDNVQNNSDPYFHYASINQIRNHVNNGSGNNCDAAFASGNDEPTVSAGPNIAIPASTPFFLTATGSDPNGDTVFYCWEEYNRGPQRDVSASDNGSSPIFRSFEPTTNPTRYFPDLLDLNNGNITRGEKLPTVSRNMVFRVTARDYNPAGGGTDTDTASVFVNTNCGPFDVTSQSSPVTITDGQLNVTWNVANTDTQLGAFNVDILFSDNSGASFDYILASAVPNDGSETVALPNIITNSGRVMVRATGLSFFDMNSAAITVDVPPEPVVISYPNGLPTELDEGVTTDFLVNIDPGTFTLDTDELFILHATNFSVPLFRADLVPQGGNNYTATLPAGACDDEIFFNIHVNTTTGPEIIDPADPNNPFSATVVCDTNDCLADVNGDGAVTPTDFTAWVNAFNNNLPECDQNGDNACTPTDFTAWVNNFNAGCP
ncbi:MAG: hypothetical protein ED559_14090 [Phycisphaera sp.]|nr:MAG: hypothetical protein ED559_14090 [Phycisphaera sp.]